MIQERARALALIAGNVPPHISQRNYEEAKIELTGETDFDRQEAVLEADQVQDHPLSATIL
ncbi:MAG: hypothetical protein WCL04_09830 [Verrucomicrobiota bacterium]